MQKNVIQTQQMILFTFVPKLILYFTCSPENYATFAELNSDFIVRFILVRFVIATKEMK